VADRTGATGLECSNVDIVKLEMDQWGVVAHTNHYVLPHAEEVVEATDWLPDTRYRLSRAQELLSMARENGEVEISTLRQVLEDEVQGGGASICRSTRPDNPIATLFRIVMDLNDATASVTVGRPSEPVGQLTLLKKATFRSADEVKEKGHAILKEDFPVAQEVM